MKNNTFFTRSVSIVSFQSQSSVVIGSHPPNTKIKLVLDGAKSVYNCVLYITHVHYWALSNATNIVLPNWKLDFLKHHSIQIHLCFISYLPSIWHERICNGRLRYFISLYPESYISKHPLPTKYTQLTFLIYQSEQNSFAI